MLFDVHTIKLSQIIIMDSANCWRNLLVTITQEDDKQSARLISNKMRYVFSCRWALLCNEVLLEKNVVCCDKGRVWSLIVLIAGELKPFCGGVEHNIGSNQNWAVSESNLWIIKSMALFLVVFYITVLWLAGKIYILTRLFCDLFTCLHKMTSGNHVISFIVLDSIMFCVKSNNRLYHKLQFPYWISFQTHLFYHLSAGRKYRLTMLSVARVVFH